METRSGLRANKSVIEEPQVPVDNQAKMALKVDTSPTSMDKLTAILAKLEATVRTMDVSFKTLTTDTTTNTESFKKLNKDLTKRMDDLIANDTNNTQNIKLHETKINMLTADIQMLKKDMKERQHKEKELKVTITGIPESAKNKCMKQWHIY